MKRCSVFQLCETDAVLISATRLIAPVPAMSTPKVSPMSIVPGAVSMTGRVANPPAAL